MNRPTPRQPDTLQRLATPVLLVVAILFAGRAAWLIGAADTKSAVNQPSVAQLAVAPSGELAEELEEQVEAATPRRRLTEDEFASIAGLCPTAINELPEEILPLSMLRRASPGNKVAPPHRLTSAKEGGPRGRLTGIRVASRETSPSQSPPPSATSAPADGWLVAPENWFVPEDKPPIEATDKGAADEIGGQPQKPAAADPEEPEGTATGELDRESIDQETPTDSQRSEASPDWAPEPRASKPEAQTLPAAEPPEAVEWPVDNEPLSSESRGEIERDAGPVEKHSSAESGNPWPDTSYPDTATQPKTRSIEAEQESEAAIGPTFAPPGVASPADAAAETASIDDKPAGQVVTEPLFTEDGPLKDEASEEAAAPKPSWNGPFDRVAPPARRPEPEQAAEAGDPATLGAEKLLLDQESAAREMVPSPQPVEESVESLPSPEPSDPTRESEVAAPSEPEEPPRKPLAEAIPAPKPAMPVPTATVQPKTAPTPRTRPLFTPPPAQATAPQPVSAGRPAANPLSQQALSVMPLHPGAGPAAAAQARQAAHGKSADESHRELFAKNNYPSAQDCAQCHERIYDEWRVSSHAYAFVSPMYHKFEQTITKLSQGTVGHFCQRCHSPVATAMYEPRSIPLDEVAPAAKEGVTCIVCHRVNQRWGKSNGDRRIEPGDIYAPIYGGVGGEGVAQAIAEKKKYKVKTSPHEKGPGQAIHTEGRFFDQLTKAEACTSCHQVAVHPGVKLEVVWEQYRASPACKKGITCQDCHMGRIPGVAAGYNYGPIAELNGKVVNNHRKQSSHLFYGPGYSIAHPGIFPHNQDAEDWTVNEWLLFDWRAGWGTDEFEEKIEELEDRGVGTAAWFPPVWAESDDRCDAREIIDDNLEHLAKKRHSRELVMENGSKVDGPFFADAPIAGRDLKFEYVVANLNEGHNLPTASLGAQPQLWANVVLIDPMGRRVWESGYTDSNGDLCDIHSVDVRKGKLPFDKQLFNLQTMFLITGATGTDREFYLPVNLDIDQVAQLRPGALPITVLNHPPFIRMEMRSLAPLGKKRVNYTVPAELMRSRGRYRLSFRMRSRTEPMYFMRLCESTPEMLRAMTEGTLDIHPQSVEFEVR